MEIPAAPERKRPILRDVAHGRFMHHLFSGALRPGQLVSQRELCEMLDVPMGPMREALKRLEAESIVTLIPQRGIRILDIGEQVINDTFELRKLIEVEAVRRYATRGGLEAAEDLLARTVAASRADDDGRSFDIATIHALTTLDHEMHYLFLGALGNELALDLFRRMLGQLRLSRLVYRLRNYRDRQAFKEHIEILQLVLDRRVEAAAAAMDSHLDASWRRALGLD